MVLALVKKTNRKKTLPNQTIKIDIIRTDI